MQKLKLIKTVIASVLLIVIMASVVACNSTTPVSSDTNTESTSPISESVKESESPSEPEKNTDPINVVWYPNESSNTHTDVRDAVGEIIEQATGRKVEHKLTTDYTIAIEAIASGSADMAMAMGAVGYIEAKNKNPEIDVLFVNADADGKLDGAKYFSWLCVPADKAEEYKDGDAFSIDKIKGQKMSFVSNSSTSGFKVPTTSIIEHFAAESLTEDDLLPDGEFFSEVFFGQSHQGSAVNLLDGNVDVAAFCDIELQPYIELKTGEANTVGAVYTVKEGAEAPFDKFVGKDFTVIACTPVFNGPNAVNPKNLSTEEIEAIRALFTSEEVANNEAIFYDEEKEGSTGLYKKQSSKGYVAVQDSWYDAYR